MNRWLIIPACLPLLFGGAWAQDVPEGAEDEAARLQEIERQRAENRRAAEEIRERTAAAQAALDALKTRLVTTAESLQAAESRATDVETNLARLKAEEAAARIDLEGRQRAMSNVLAALQSLERSRPPALAVSPDDANNAAVAAIALAAITPDLKEEADRLRADLARLATLQEQMAQEQLALEEAETALSERRRLLQDLLDERESAQQQDTAQLRRLEAENARLGQEATTLRELIAALEERERNPPPAVAPDENAPEIYANLPDRFSNARGSIPLPVAGQVVIQYGEPLPGGGRAEDLTLATRPGAVVTAPFGGRVGWAEPFGRLGNVVILDVGEEFRLVLIGLGTLQTRRGDMVRAGEPLGTMDDTPNAALRFQIRRQNTPIDPGPWLLDRGRAAMR